MKYNKSNRLPSIILNQLSKQPMSGYDLYIYCCEIGWTVSHQQVYREMKRMTEKGYVEFEEIAQDSKPNKRVYSILETGKNYLTQVYNAKPALFPQRDDLMAQSLIGNWDYVRDYREMAMEKIAELLRHDQTLIDMDDFKAKSRFLINRRELSAFKSDVEWIDQFSHLMRQ